MMNLKHPLILKALVVGVLLASGTFIFSSCGSSQRKESSTISFKKPAFRVQPYETKVLPNGLTLIYVKDKTLPRVALKAMVKTGLRQEPTEKAGLNSLVASLLSQGTNTRSAIQISDALNAMGTEFSVSAGGDAVMASADALTPDAENLLDLFSEILMKPSFSVAEVRRLQTQQIAALQKRIDNPGMYARVRFSEFLMIGTSYGRDAQGTVPTLRGIGQKDVIKYYLAHYRPGNTVIAVSGRFDRGFEQKVEQIFGGWVAREIKPAGPQVFVTPEKTELKVVTKKDLAQTQIMMGQVTVPRTHPDHLALRLANEALGGGFGARLMQKIRDDLGLTYSVYSVVTANQSTGSFQISTFTKNPTVGKTVEETLKVVSSFIREGMTEKELNMAKAQILGQYPQDLETADAVASTLMSLNLLGLPFEEIGSYPRKIERFTLAEVNRAVQTHLSPEKLKILVYTDRAALGAQLDAMQPVFEVAK